MKSSTIYKISGTDTYRLASRKLKLFNDPEPIEMGMNLQNQPDKISRIFKPSKENYRFIQTDQAGAEALIVSMLCRKGKYRDLFLHNVKPHVFMGLHLAADIWKLKLLHLNIDKFLAAEPKDLKALEGWKELDSLIKESDSWPSAERYYFIAKMVIHASSYGMKGPTFQMNVLQKSDGTISLSIKQANYFLGMFHNIFPEIQEWHRITDNLLMNDRQLRNLFGHPRVFTGHIDDSTKRKAYAFVPQSTVGCITHYAIIMMQQYIEANNVEWNLLNNKHDSMLLECPLEEVSLCALKSKEFMEQQLDNGRGESFRMKAEVSVGNNWGKFKVGENEEGMKEYKI